MWIVDFGQCDKYGFINSSNCKFISTIMTSGWILIKFKRLVVCMQQTHWATIRWFSISNLGMRYEVWVTKFQIKFKRSIPSRFRLKRSSRSHFASIKTPFWFWMKHFCSNKTFSYTLFGYWLLKPHFLIFFSIRSE